VAATLAFARSVFRHASTTFTHRGPPASHGMQTDTIRNSILALLVTQPTGTPAARPSASLPTPGDRRPRRGADGTAIPAGSSSRPATASGRH
jgi:hypothetical protein